MTLYLGPSKPRVLAISPEFINTDRFMMGSTNGFQGRAYQPQEDVYFNDGREIELLHFVYEHPSLDSMRGDPEKVLAAIDEFGERKKYLMNVGRFKGKIITDLIAETKPKIVVELGGYVGYSAIAFGAALRAVGGKKYFTLELNPEFGAVILSLVHLAGLDDIVRVEVGKSSASLRRLYNAGSLEHIDLLFLDHYKPAYTPDLKLCEELGLVGPGSVYAADNVIKPGNPPYLEYVRSTVSQKRAKHLGSSLETSSGNQDKAKQLSGQDEVEQKLLGKGNPNLIYESTFVEGWEPSGVADAIEITRCTGTE